jgi:hypothetical protein
MALCVSVIEPDRWGTKDRMKGCLKSLQNYGASAKEVLPKLRETRTYLAKVKKSSADTLAEFDKAIAVIESSTATPTLVSVAEFKTRPAAK